MLVPEDEGPACGPVIMVCVAVGTEPDASELLMMSTGMSRIDVSLPRRHFGQRTRCLVGR